MLKPLAIVDSHATTIANSYLICMTPGRMTPGLSRIVCQSQACNKSVATACDLVAMADQPWWSTTEA
jgi:hypothetical protein